MWGILQWYQRICFFCSRFIKDALWKSARLATNDRIGKKKVEIHGKRPLPNLKVLFRHPCGVHEEKHEKQLGQAIPGLIYKSTPAKIRNWGANHCTLRTIALLMATANTFETSANVYQIARRHIPEEIFKLQNSRPRIRLKLLIKSQKKNQKEKWISRPWFKLGVQTFKSAAFLL